MWPRSAKLPDANGQDYRKAARRVGAAVALPWLLRAAAYDPDGYRPQRLKLSPAAGPRMRKGGADDQFCRGQAGPDRNAGTPRAALMASGRFQRPFSDRQGWQRTV
jgi:hypothetical protein